MLNNCTRRQWLAAAAGAALVRPFVPAASAEAGRAPRVAIARCATYGPELLPAMQRMFDQLGGLGRLVNGKTVAIKINMTGDTNFRLGHLPAEDTHYTHPRVIAAAVHLMGRAGARRVRLLESCWSSSEPLEEFMLQANWEPRDLAGAAALVEFENTNYLGRARKYARLATPQGGHLFPAFDLNHSYQDCDVFVSIAKMKDHATAGVTLSMKNCFGITPVTIYGDGAGSDEPSIEPHGGRGIMHDGHRQPSKSAPPEHDPATPRDDGYRVPRIVADLVAARPIDLAIVEAVRSMAGGEGPWVKPSRAIRPGVLVAGTNCVATDAVCMAVMGYDPMAVRGTPPFEKCDSTLQLAEALGVGPRDLRRIELAGTPLREALFHYRV
ncbi:MAG TPA: DUF362 domain-containing protein [Bryobacteraceae bacterium]|jgi:uncharacterized protein (DUF362 family)|nr:DUF362 domain-containing protein [Bryobacteraceae bacterium]